MVDNVHIARAINQIQGALDCYESSAPEYPELNEALQLLRSLNVTNTDAAELSYSELVFRLHAASSNPFLAVPFRQALSQALVTVEQTNAVLRLIAENDFDAGYEMAKASGLLKEFAKLHMTSYGSSLLVSELYDESEDFSLALHSLVGPNFSYADWSHLTIEEVLKKF